MLTRRSALTLLAATAAWPRAAYAVTPRELEWDDLIPPGLPYGLIVGEGEINYENDTWRPIYDANAHKVNETLNGEYIKMPGYIIPMDFSSEGVTDFILVPYVGACIHTPPPPPNQLVMVKTPDPWPNDQLWDPVWVTGTMRTEALATELGDIGYAIAASKLEAFIW